MNVKSDFQSFGLTILLTPTKNEARPDLINQKPRGYDTGGGYDNCPGFFMPGEKKIYVAEKYGVYSQPFRVSDSVLETILHECGHAYDAMRADASKSEAFLTVYRQDCGKLTNESRRGVTYFLQADSAGPSELFADLFAFAMAPELKDESSVKTCFPLTYQFMKDQTGDKH